MATTTNHSSLKEINIAVSVDEDGVYVARILECKGVFGQGRTEDAAIADARKGYRTWLDYYDEAGKAPPYVSRKAASGENTHRVRVRMTS